MRSSDTHPGHETSYTSNIDQPGESCAVADSSGNQAKTADDGREDQGPDRNTQPVGVTKEPGSLALTSECHHDTGGGIQARITGREHGSKDNSVDNGGAYGDTGLYKDEGEWSGPDVIAEKIWIIGREDEALKEDGDNIEEKNTPEDVTDGTGNSLARIAGFASCDTHELGALEGKTSREKYTNSTSGTILKCPRVGVILEADPLTTDRTSIDKDGFVDFRMKYSK